ncbi:MAG TPA: hypothetical protein VK447_16150 [Myxococcaceae bacterium]|nr:hypothetical protein [Myxococcaceae bacterium]
MTKKDFIFGDGDGPFPEGSSADNDLEGADIKTLRLAAAVVTPERLDQLVRYQRAWLEAVKRLGSDAMAEVDAEALAKSGMAPAELGALLALVRDFCGKRWTMRTLERRHAELQNKRDNDGLDEREARKLESLDAELHKLDTLKQLERRYGAPAVLLLRSREDELIALHQAVGQALRQGPANR